MSLHVSSFYSLKVEGSGNEAWQDAKSMNVYFANRYSSSSFTASTEPFLSLGNSWYGTQQLSLTCAGSPGSSLGRCPQARVSLEFLLHHLCGKLRTAWHSARSGAVPEEKGLGRQNGRGKKVEARYNRG